MQDEEKYFRQARKINNRLFAFKKKARILWAREPIEKKIEELKMLMRRADNIRLFRE